MSALGKVFKAWVYLEAAALGAMLGHITSAPKKRTVAKQLPTQSSSAKFDRLSTRLTRNLKPGDIYAAELDVPFFAAALVSQSALSSGLVKEGFSPLLIHDSLPQGWPGADGADWYVLAKYTGRPKTVDVPGVVRALWKQS